MQTIVYQCDTAMPAQKLPNCCLQSVMKNALLYSISRFFEKHKNIQL